MANIATMIPDGIVVVLDPEPLVDTKAGPQTAEIATVTHIAKMANDAHVSVTTTLVQSERHQRRIGAYAERSVANYCRTLRDERMPGI